MMRISSKRKGAARWLAVVAAASVLALTACGSGSPEAEPPAETPAAGATEAGSDWDAVLEAAKDEGELTVYTTIPAAQADALFDAFRDAYPEIDLISQRMGTEMYAQIDQELQNNLPGAEVVLLSHEAWIADNADAFVDLSADVPAAEEWPEWAEAKISPTISLSTIAFVGWNTDKYPKGLKEWKDLLDPALDGHIGIRNTISTSWISFLQFLEETEGPDFLPSLAALNPKGYASVDPLTNAVASGEVWVQPIGSPATVTALQDQGAAIDLAYPEKMWAFPYTGVALKKAEHPNAAKVFFEFAMSPDGQKAFNGGGKGVSPLGSSVVPDGMDFGTDDITLLDPKVTTPEVVEEWTAKFKEIFNQ